MRNLALVSLFFVALLGIHQSAAAQNPPGSVTAERAKAMAFVDQNRYLDAYPILEKIAPLLPNDADVWTHYGIAIASRSVTLSDAGERKAERRRAHAALSKAKQLGTTHVTALAFLDQMEPDGGDEDNFSAAHPDVEKALREGESFFGRGEYEKAFASYERAYKLDPTSYEAVLFMGDCRYAQKRYAESEPLFAKAAALNRDRELAYRFWGDALLNQNKLPEATEKFIDAFIADPYSRHSWENINKLTQKHGKQFNVKGIFPPGTDDFGGIKIDAVEISENDGTKLWLKYSETRAAWRSSLFLKENPGVSYRHSLKEELAALMAVAGAAETAIKAGSLKNPHHSLTTVIELRNKQILEPYILLLLADDGIAEDYEAYRDKNRDKLRRFLREHVFVF